MLEGGRRSVPNQGVFPYQPYSHWSFPGYGYHDISEVLSVLQFPHDGHYFWAHQFRFSAGDVGYAGLQVGAAPNGSRIALFSVWRANGAIGNCKPFDNEGSGYSCRIDPFRWVVGRPYEIIIESFSSDAKGTWYRSSVRDSVTGKTATIGFIRVPLRWGGLLGTSSWTEWSGERFASCAEIRAAKVWWGNPTAEGSTVHITGRRPTYGPTDRTRSCGTGPSGATTITPDPAGETQAIRPQ